MKNNVQIHELLNGLRICLIKTDCDLFKIEFIIRAGMLHESVNQLGYAHFLEHFMAFFASEEYPDSEQNNNLLDVLSLDVNAFTDEVSCGYHMEGLIQYLYLCIDMIFQNFVHPKMDQDFFEKEKIAVIQELKKHVEDPWYEVISMVQKVLYNGTVIQSNVEEEIINIENCKHVDQLFEYRKKYYCPNYSTLLITAKLSDDEFKSLCNNIERNYFPNMVKKSPQIPKITTLPKNNAHLKYPNYSNYKFYYIEGEEDDTTKLLINFKIPFQEFSEQTIPLEFLEDILTETMGSRLFRALRTELGAVYGVEIDYELNVDNPQFNFFSIQLETPEEKLIQVFDYIMIELSLFHDNTLSDPEWTKIQNSIKTIEYEYKCSKSLLECTDYYKDYLVWNPSKRMNYQTYLNKIKNLTKQNIIDCAKEIFNTDNMTVFYSSNKTIFESIDSHYCF